VRIQSIHLQQVFQNWSSACYAYNRTAPERELTFFIIENGLGIEPQFTRRSLASSNDCTQVMNIRAPVLAAPGKDQPSSSRSQPDEASGRVPEILVIEDSKTDVFLICEALDRSQVSANVHVLKDGSAAANFRCCVSAASRWCIPTAGVRSGVRRVWAPTQRVNRLLPGSVPNQLEITLPIPGTDHPARSNF
jgi:hypothetical protein